MIIRIPVVGTHLDYLLQLLTEQAERNIFGLLATAVHIRSLEVEQDTDSSDIFRLLCAVVHIIN